ncbi:hypothetical protein TNCV_106131 [Trichonephila clavipes]|nr:hypothetical protein TNCV_106131 [Trichonephila clavipes]
MTPPSWPRCNLRISALNHAELAVMGRVVVDDCGDTRKASAAFIPFWSSEVVMIEAGVSWVQACTAEDTPCREGQCTLNMSRLKRRCGIEVWRGGTYAQLVESQESVKYRLKISDLYHMEQLEISDVIGKISQAELLAGPRLQQFCHPEQNWKMLAPSLLWIADTGHHMGERNVRCDPTPGWGESY